MRLVLGVLLMGSGFVLGGAAIYLLWTGRNLPGPFGRGLDRRGAGGPVAAPSAFFRALGALLASAAMACFWLTLLVTMSADTSSLAFLLVALGGVPIAAAMTASVAWMTSLAHRHKLFTWSKQ